MYTGKTLAFFDIESSAIPASGVFDVDTIHCIGIKINDEPTMMYTSRYLPIPNYGGTLNNALDLLNSADIIIGHNIMGFDCIVVENLLGKLTAPRLDTLILSKICYTKDELIDNDMSDPSFPKDLYGSYSLEAFGIRMGNHKQDFHDWSRLTSRMTQYCTQDVEVTAHLFNNLIDSPRYPSQSVIDLENEVASIIAEQQYLGFYYDIEGGRELMKKLMHEQLTLELRLSKTFRPLFLPDGQPITPAGSRRNKIYLPDSTYKGF